MPEKTDTLEEVFANPPAKYRSAPFWSWNDRLEPKELRWQIDEMKKAGMGGFFMHSRYGLETPFLSDDWWKAVGASIDQARKNGMCAWIYDEDRWPSGTAGGIVTKKHPEFAGWLIECIEGRLPEDSLEPIASYRLRFRGKKVTSAELISDVEQAKKARGKGIVHIVVHPYAPTPWYNDQCYIDVMNLEAVRAFIDIGLEPYRERYGDDFGGVVPGVFTDEPNILNVGTPGTVLPWTPKFEEEFESDHGYEFRPEVLGIFFETSNSRKIRHDYWKTVTRLFEECFTKEIAEWCGENNLMLTGHFLLEQPHAAQTISAGAVMPHYVHMQLPGMDLLCDRIDELCTGKQVSSVCNQFGQRRAMSELYGVTSWNYSFEMQKRQGDWHMAMGINFRCQHLALYSLRGGRKRDYPQSYLYQSPWWDYYPKVEDYFARVSHILSEGEYASDILLIHNISSTHCEYDAEHRWGKEQWFEGLHQTMSDMFALQREFDLGDEWIMENHSEVVDGKLRVGKKDYCLVVVPPALNLRSSTLKLLQEFAQAGGAIVAVRPTPTLLDGAKSNEIKEFFRGEGVRVVMAKRPALKRALNAAHTAPWTGKAKKGRDFEGVYSHTRTIDGKTVVFFSNTRLEKETAFSVQFSGPGTLRRWNTDDGTVTEIPSLGAPDGPAKTGIVLPPVGSEIISWEPAGSSNTDRRPALREVARKALYGPWKIERSTPNALTLDTCEVKLENGPWSPALYIRKAAQMVYRHFGLKHAPGNQDQQPWAMKERGLKEFPPTAKVALRFAFEMAVKPDQPISLALESPERFLISVNGKAIEAEPTGWYVDKCIQTFDVSHAAKLGANQIVLETTMAEDLEFECIYLIGEFGVDRMSRHLIEAPTELRIGDWCDQGLPYYCGSVRYLETIDWEAKDGERLILELSSHRASAVAVHVNGSLASVMGWKPYCIDITDFLEQGENSLAIEIIGSGRNLMGPHHFRFPGIPFTQPGHFEAENEKEHIVEPYGISGAVNFIRKK